MMPTNSNNQGLLSYWKEIAAYLDCDERTCRRWELDFGLPVHRMEGTAKFRVFAYKDELDAWRRERLNGILKANGRGLSVQKLRGSRAVKMLPWILPFLVVIIAAAIFLFRPSPGQPVDFGIEGSKPIILDENGKKLWDFDTRLDDLISEQNYRDHFQVASRPPSDGTFFPYLFIKDLNGDGKNEVLFIPIAKDWNNEFKLYCFESRGKELWQYRTGRELVFGDHSYSPDYIIFGMELFDTNDDGNLEVFMFIGHRPHSPSSLVILDCHGRPMGEFINWGRMHDMACTDPKRPTYCLRMPSRRTSLTKQFKSLRMNSNQFKRNSFMPKTITLRLSDEDYQRFLSFAQADNRPIANAIETLALRQLEETLFVDPFEMESIQADQDLQKRLKEGSAQSRKLKGRFVE